MFHDVAILLGIFAWLGKELDGVFLAALLTVIGYSINDSVVVFDRIREQRRERSTEPLERVANDACLDTIPRTINTGLGALFILVALYVLGGETLTDFALALLIGIAVGTYSSMFTAAPLAVAFERPEPATHQRPRKPRITPAVPRSDPTCGPQDEPKVLVPAASPAPRRPSPPAGAPAPRPRKNRRRGGRRR
jgi:SecD/SecF fusion protein